MNTKSLMYTVAFSFVRTSSFAVMTSARFLDTRTDSNLGEFKSFLLSMCTDAPVSTTNSLSPGLNVGGVGTHQTSESEKNVALFFYPSILEFHTVAAKSNDALLAHCSFC